MSDYRDAPRAAELVHFSKCYRSHWPRPALTAVDDVSLHVSPGEVLGLLGPNGSGKSTILKALAGLVRPTAGACRVFDRMAGSDEARAWVGYLPEAPTFPAHLNGREFLEYCAGLSGGVAKERLAELVLWSGLSAAIDRPLREFSRGMRQRIGIAQAVLHDPALVLLDEPTEGLDPHGRLALDGLIRDLARQGKAVVFSSHLLEQAASLCDRIAIFGRGRLIASGTAAEILGNHAPSAQPSRLEQFYLARVQND